MVANPNIINGLKINIAINFSVLDKPKKMILIPIKKENIIPVTINFIPSCINSFIWILSVKFSKLIPQKVDFNHFPWKTTTFMILYNRS